MILNEEARWTLANLYSFFLAEADEAVVSSELLLEDRVSSSLSLRVSFSVWKEREKGGQEVAVNFRNFIHAISIIYPSATLKNSTSEYSSESLLASWTPSVLI